MEFRKQNLLAEVLADSSRLQAEVQESSGGSQNQKHRRQVRLQGQESRDCLVSQGSSQKSENFST